MFRALSVLLLPFSAFFSVWALHIGRPAGAGLIRLKLRYRVERDQIYTPPDWSQSILADIYVPKDAAQDARPWPAVLLIHGGAWFSGDRPQVQFIAERLAARGFVVVNVTYRLVPKYRFPSPLQDIQQAIRWMRKNAQRYGFDSSRIAVWGYSAGAHLAALQGALTSTDRLYDEEATVSAIVAGGTPADLRKFRGGTLVPNFLGEKWSESSVIFRESSPAAHVTAAHPPTFLYHGNADFLVPPDQAIDYKVALDAAGVVNELYLMRGLGHIGAFLMDGEAVQLGADFLDRHLRSVPGR